MSNEDVHITQVNNGNNGKENGLRFQYSMPGILHFLQTEWARFEMERAQWEVERAELQARIAFLQGERKGQENLKHDLVRRIKMLEFALKQERSKYNRIKYGDSNTERNSVDMKSEDDPMDATDILQDVTPASNSTWRQGRQLLRQYLQEIGYADTIIDVRSARVRSLLGLQPLDNQMMNGDVSSQQIRGGRDQQSNKPGGKRTTGQQPPSGVRSGNGTSSVLSPAQTALLNTEESVLETLDFLQGSSAVVDDDDDSDEEAETGEVGGGAELMNDPDTEEAIAEFDFLLSETSDGAGETTSSENVKSEDWGVDKQILSKLKEEYRRERKAGKKTGTVQRVTRRGGPGTAGGVPQTISVSGEGIDDEAALDSQEIPEIDDTGVQGGGSMPFGGVKAADGSAGGGAVMTISSGSVGTEEETLSLGELAALTVSNESEMVTYDISESGEISRKTWNTKYTLRSHFDGVRALAFHPVESVLVTASEDDTLKLWNLQKTSPAKKNNTVDVEPVYTFRGHLGPVLSLAMSATGEQCYSGGIDSVVRCWTIPNSNIDPYDSYDASVMQTTLMGHSDAIWGLALHSTKTQLLSCSADHTIKLWSPGAKRPLLNTYTSPTNDAVPSCIDFIRCESNQMVAAYTNGSAYVFELETGKLMVTLDPEADTASQINRIVSHPTLPVIITAHDDRHIRFYDHSTGKLLHSMVAHLDAVTSLAIDPNGLYLLSGSHDSSVRLWNVDTKTCVQEITAHRKKHDEAIHDLAFHPSKPYFASAGADGLAKVFV